MLEHDAKYVCLVSLAAVCGLLTVALSGAPAKDLNRLPDSLEGKVYFKVKVVDSETGRGIPAVRLETTSHRKYFTDSNGVAAIYEPGLMGEKVWFTVTSFGYQFPNRDFFGDPGFRVKLKPGGSTTIEMNRTMIGERLSRSTGLGLYRHSFLTGENVPVKRPFFRGGVVGNDSPIGAVFKDKIYWFFGDPGYIHTAFSHFATSGGTSSLPQNTDLDPKKGMNLNYFLGDESDNRFEGFAKPLYNKESGQGSFALWRAMVVNNQGEEELFSYFTELSGGQYDTLPEALNSLKESSHGIGKWSEDKQRFEIVEEFPLDKPFKVRPVLTQYQNNFRVQEGGDTWFYFPNAYPTMRVPAEAQALRDPSQYQIFTPIKQGTEWDDGSPQLVREDDQGDLDGQAQELKWEWKPLTAPITTLRETMLVEENTIRRSEGIHHLTKTSSGKPLEDAYWGAVYWNPYREKWTMVYMDLVDELSIGGEIWYAEADSPLGPWVYTQKILTHPGHVYYQPAHNPFFNQKEGRVLLINGTFHHCCQVPPGSPRTPRHNYNTMIYRVDLADTRLYLPTPVYRQSISQGRRQINTYRTFKRSINPGPERSTIPFYAYPPDRPPQETIAVWEERRFTKGTPTFGLTTVASNAAFDTPAFYALPDADPSNPSVVPLHEYQNQQTGELRYRTPKWAQYLTTEWTRSTSEPIVYVRKSPNLDPPRNPNAEPDLSCQGVSAHCDG